LLYWQYEQGSGDNRNNKEVQRDSSSEVEENL
jgi:hypothetical protein